MDIKVIYLFCILISILVSLYLSGKESPTYEKFTTTDTDLTSTIIYGTNTQGLIPEPVNDTVVPTFPLDKLTASSSPSISNGASLLVQSSAVSLPTSSPAPIQKSFINSVSSSLSSSLPPLTIPPLTLPPLPPKSQISSPSPSPSSSFSSEPSHSLFSSTIKPTTISYTNASAAVPTPTPSSLSVPVPISASSPAPSPVSLLLKVPASSPSSPFSSAPSPTLFLASIKPSSKSPAPTSAPSINTQVSKDPYTKIYKDKADEDQMESQPIKYMNDTLENCKLECNKNANCVGISRSIGNSTSDINFVGDCTLLQSPYNLSDEGQDSGWTTYIRS